jgi:hypothetical protein
MMIVEIRKRKSCFDLKYFCITTYVELFIGFAIDLLIEKNLLFYYNFVGVENIAGLNQLYFI